MITLWNTTLATQIYLLLSMHVLVSTSEKESYILLHKLFSQIHLRGDDEETS